MRCIVTILLFLISACWGIKADDNIKKDNKVRHTITIVDSILKVKKPTFKERMKTRFNMLNSELDAQQPTTDTQYVTRPPQPWTIKIRYDAKRSYYSTDDVYEGQRYNYYFDNELNSTIGLNVNYRGFSIALSLNPKKVLGKNNDTEFNLNYYNNKFGADFTYSNMKRFHYSNNWFDLKTGKDDVLGNTKLASYSANFYYVFNNRKFSYPAAFTHSWIQKRSAGSFIAGTSLYYGKINVDLNAFDLEKATKLQYMVDDLTMKYVSLNFGYAYNYVPSKHWLLHASFTPGLMLWKDYEASIVKFKIEENFEENKESVDYEPYAVERLPKRFFDWTGIIRIGATYSWQKYFLGATFVKQFDNIGDENIATIYGSRWKIRAYFGVRL